MYWKKVKFMTKTGKIRLCSYWSDDGLNWCWVGAKKP